MISYQLSWLLLMVGSLVLSNSCRTRSTTQLSVNELEQKSQVTIVPSSEQDISFMSKLGYELYHGFSEKDLRAALIDMKLPENAVHAEPARGFIIMRGQERIGYIIYQADFSARNASQQYVMIHDIAVHREFFLDADVLKVIKYFLDKASSGKTLAARLNSADYFLRRTLEEIGFINTDTLEMLSEERPVPEFNPETGEKNYVMRLYAKNLSGTESDRDLIRLIKESFLRDAWLRREIIIFKVKPEYVDLVLSRFPSLKEVLFKDSFLVERAKRTEEFVIPKELEQKLLQSVIGGKAANIKITGPAGSGKSFWTSIFFIRLFLGYYDDAVSAEAIAKANLQGIRTIKDLRINAYFFEVNPEVFLAGTSWRGQLEKVVMALKELVDSGERVIMYVDEAHRLAGASLTGRKGDDFFEVFKTALAKENLTMCLVSTPEEMAAALKGRVAVLDRISYEVVLAGTEEGVLSAVKAELRYQGLKMADEEAVARRIVELSLRFDPHGGLPRSAILLIGHIKRSLSLKQNNGIETLTPDTVDRFSRDYFQYPSLALTPREVALLPQKVEELFAAASNEAIRSLGAQFRDIVSKGVALPNSANKVILLSGDKTTNPYRRQAIQLFSQTIGRGDPLIVDLASFSSPNDVLQYLAEKLYSKADSHKTVVLTGWEHDLSKWGGQFQMLLAKILAEGQFETHVLDKGIGGSVLRRVSIRNILPVLLVDEIVRTYEQDGVKKKKLELPIRSKSLLELTEGLRVQLKVSDENIVLGEIQSYVRQLFKRDGLPVKQEVIDQVVEQARREIAAKKIKDPREIQRHTDMAYNHWITSTNGCDVLNGLNLE